MKLLHMTLPAEFRISPSLSAGGSDSDSGASLGSAHPEREGVRVAALDLNLYRDPRWCSNCGGVQMFVAVFECEAGRVGDCLRCGEGKFIPWTRTNSEVA